MVKAYVTGNNGAYTRYSNSLTDKSASTVKSGVSSYTKEQYLSGKMTQQQAIKVLTGINGLSYDEATKKLAEWKNPKPKTTKMWGE